MYAITKEKYYHLSPIYGSGGICANSGRVKEITLRNGTDGYFFIGSESEYLEALQRCKYMH